MFKFQFCLLWPSLFYKSHENLLSIGSSLVEISEWLKGYISEKNLSRKIFLYRKAD